MFESEYRSLNIFSSFVVNISCGLILLYLVDTSRVPGSAMDGAPRSPTSKLKPLPRTGNKNPLFAFNSHGRSTKLTMVAFLPLFSIRLPSFSLLSSIPYPAFVNFSWATFPGHGWLYEHPPNGLPFRHSGSHLIHCNTVGALSGNLHMDLGLISLFRGTGIGEHEAHLLLAKNPTIAYCHLEKIRSRMLSLQLVGIEGLDLAHLILKCPNILTAAETDSLLLFLLNELEGEIEPAQLTRLLTAVEPRFLVGFDVKVRLILDLGVPREKIAHVLNNVNLSKAFCIKSVEEIDKTFKFLHPFGGVDLIVRRPQILNYDFNTQLAPRIDNLLKLSGGDEHATRNVLQKLPAILSYSVQHVGSHVMFLRSFAGLSDRQIFKIILGYPTVISASRERKLRPRIEFLKQCGLNSEDIFKFLIKAPLFLGLSFENNIAYKLVFLVKIGYMYRTKELAVAMGSLTRTSCENLQKVVGLYLSYGFSYADILAMSQKHPQILQYNHNSLKEKIEYLTEEMGREITELLSFPAFLGYKLDDRIKIRYEEKTKTTGERMSLNKLLTVSHDRFLTKKEKKASASTP